MENIKSKPNFWAVLPATVRYDDVVGSTAKIIFAEITALSNLEGYCWASNQYFADLFKISVTQVSRLVSELEKRGFVKTFVEKGGGNLRKIYPQITAESSSKADEKKETLEEKFDKIVGQVDAGLKEERIAFLEYFSAVNDGGTKEHWQKQKTFAIRQRWSTWVRNTKKWEKPKFPSDKEIKTSAVGQAVQRQEAKSRQEIMNTKRTPAEQARVDKTLADMRKNLKNKLTLKP